MGSVGDAYDNAMCESFFATLECELLELVVGDVDASIAEPLERRLHAESPHHGGEVRELTSGRPQEREVWAP